MEVKREMAKIARGRLEFDKAQAASEKRFCKMGSGTRVTILLSAAAMILGAIVSASNVWVSKITNDKERPWLRVAGKSIYVFKDYFDDEESFDSLESFIPLGAVHAEFEMP